MLEQDEFMTCPMLYQNHCMHRMNQGQVVCPYATRDFNAYSYPYPEEYSFYSPVVNCIEPQSSEYDDGNISSLFRNAEDMRVRKVPIYEVTD